jgi:hypothetical protein
MDADKAPLIHEGDVRKFYLRPSASICGWFCFVSSRPFVARPTKHELYDFAGSTFGEVGSIRG